MAITIDGAGTITGLDADGISSQPVFAGNVLQVVSANNNTSLSTSSSSFQATGLTASITPTSTTSKILVLVNQSIAKSGLTSTAVALFKNGVQFIVLEQFVADNAGSAINAIGSVSTSYLDSPATTSAVTYSTAIRATAGVASAISNYIGAFSTITLMEIAG